MTMQRPAFSKTNTTTTPAAKPASQWAASKPKPAAPAAKSAPSRPVKSLCVKTEEGLKNLTGLFENSKKDGTGTYLKGKDRESGLEYLVDVTRDGQTVVKCKNPETSKFETIAFLREGQSKKEGSAPYLFGSLNAESETYYVFDKQDKA